MAKTRGPSGSGAANGGSGGGNGHRNGPANGKHASGHNLSHGPGNGPANGKHGQTSPFGISGGIPGSATPDGSASWLADDSELAALEAELEHGWQLIESGESGSLEEARKLSEDLLRRYPDAPEVLVLLGMLDSLEGEIEQALSRYEEASKIDPEYFEPLLCAAELYIWELGEDEKGLELCQRAQEVAEEEEEYLDALLLQAEAEINLGHERAALATLRQLPDIDLPEPRYHVRAGRLFLDLEQPKEAAHHFQRSIELDPENGDGLHGLGLCAEQRGERQRMIDYFLKVREVDLRAERPPWGLDEASFQKVCATTLDNLPDELRRRMANVPVIATDYPSEQMVKDGSDPRMLGLFTGVPFGEHSNVGGAPHLEAIFLFQRNIERLAYSSEDVEHEVHVTLVHEAGHFFGLSEKQLEAMGLG